MNPKLRPTALLAALVLAGCAQVVHTPPGTSVEVALAKKPELVKLPAPVEPNQATTGGGERVPAVEPPMPAKDALVEKVGEAYSRGIFCLQAERDAEAIAAFEEVVKLDPTFTDAWEKLATLYEKMGEAQKSLDAFKKAKTFAGQ